MQREDEIEALVEAIDAGLARPVDGDTNVRRLVHGRGRTLAGLEELVVDQFAATLRIGVHGERDEAWTARLRSRLGERLGTRLDGERGGTVAGVWLQWRGRAAAPQEVLLGAPAEELEVREAGLRYLVCPGRNRNAGLFLDAAPARRWVRAQARDARVLNLFAYTCAFSVAALAGGAAEVVNLDMARATLDTGRDNHRRNDLRGATFLSHELFRSWGALRRRGPFDLLILDPPSFQRGSFEADRDWPKLLRRLDGLLGDGGRVLVCLNSPFHGPAELDGWRRRDAPDFEVLERLPPCADFPDLDPQRGLKVQIWGRRQSV
ncbi:MAG TPA: class I SAM-dependent methyltransferase [Pseudomonadales bacterium]|nr:class I SAM-dependent methyltransferase [Pseudomonadales bacterium]